PADRSAFAGRVVSTGGVLGLTFSRSGGFGLRFAIALVAGRLVMGCGARSTLESTTPSHGAGGAKTSTSTAAVGSGGAASSTMMSSASTSSSSSTGTGAPPMCASDDDCAGAGFCWFGACVTVHLLAAGGDQACAVTSAGGVQCWGDNSFGELGNDSNETSQIPIGVEGLASGIAGVAAGLDHECAWTNAGAVLCWGTNVAGQLGDGTLADSAMPVPVMGLPSPIVLVSAGAAHTCAVTTGGGVLCWGWNGHGQLGNGTLADSAVPVAVTGLSSGVTALAAGGLYNCAVVGGGAQCWGNDHDGELGDGTTTQSP